MGSDEWYVGDRVYVPRISTDESINLKIVDFEGDEEDPDPDVRLLLTETKLKKGSNTKFELVRQQFRYAKLSELQDPPVGKATKGGAFARQSRGLAPIQCECGCGQETSGTRFRQGHDAKIKSRLRKIALGLLEDERMSPEDAQNELTKRGWT